MQRKVGHKKRCRLVAPEPAYRGNRPPQTEHPNSRHASLGTGGENPFAWRFAVPMYIGSALNPINSSLIATALLSIAMAMHVPVGRTAVLVTALYLACAIAQPTGGKLAEVFGPRRVFLSGILIVLAGGIVGGIAQNLATLIVARVLIGIGTSAGYPSAMLLIRRRAEWAGMAEPPGGVLGGLQIAATVTAALGLPLGGVLIGAWGWRAVFFANVPVTLAAFLMAAFWIPKDPPVETKSVRDIASRIDILGILGFGATVTALLVFLFSVPHINWVALGLSVILAMGLVVFELRASQPFFDVRLLASNLALSGTYLRMALLSLCVYTVLYGISQWLEAARGVSAREAGLLLLPMSALSAIVVRPIARRNLLRGPLIAAAVSSLVASLGVVLLTTRTPILWLLSPLRKHDTTDLS
ncbi:MFS transporter [Sulfobacillus sp. DSM 109850]|uniref:MFS transporter n=2 Tax=Sulfobacillus harzensis TaxID=2729629 RepID=A0A7Y0L6K4_9FIRM|nr:MFS transporter [Sulfobacillus harzensis]